DMHVDRDRLSVKGRNVPVEYERLYTPNGVVVAQDRERALVYTLRWTGTEYGGAAELAALGIARAESWPDFRAALARWKAPAADFVYADVDGRVARQRSGLVPIRPAGAGLLPSAGWLGARGWQGFSDLTLQTDGLEASAGPGEERSPVSAADLARSQRDVRSANASALISRLETIGSVPKEIDAVRSGLVAWDRLVRGDSKEAALYRAWEGALRQRLAARLVRADLVAEFAARLDPVSLLNGPVSNGAGGDIGPWRDILLVDALSDALKAQAGSQDPRVRFTFPHPLAVFDDARRRFEVGGYPLNGHTDTVFSTDGKRGPVVQAVFDLADWDRSTISNPPGQAGSPSSAHYDDLAARWATGEQVNLLFNQIGSPSPGSQTLALEPR
ncbi:MAG: penicillin acylase family protein, partial [Vicinamibacterales bacterium]